MAYGAFELAVAIVFTFDAAITVRGIPLYTYDADISATAVLLENFETNNAMKVLAPGDPATSVTIPPDDLTVQSYSGGLVIPGVYSIV